MKTLEEVIKELPENIRLPIYEAFQVFKEDIIHKEIVEIKNEIKEVWKAIKELAEAQKRTEERIEGLAKRVEELAEAQKELAEAQKRTEQRVEKLADELTKLTRAHAITREQLGGLSHTFGYVLEDRAMKSLPRILKKDYNVEIIGELKRDYIEINGKYIEVNIYGKAKKEDKEYILIGEVKSKISKRIIDGFITKCEKISKESIKILVSYIFTPEIKKYAEEKGIILISSYKLDL